MTDWDRLFNQLFFDGVSDLVLTARPGVNNKEAFEMIKSNMRRRDIPHEVKQDLCVKLFEEYFESGEWNGK